MPCLFCRRWRSDLPASMGGSIGHVPGIAPIRRPNSWIDPENLAMLAMTAGADMRILSWLNGRSGLLSALILRAIEALKFGATPGGLRPWASWAARHPAEPGRCIRDDRRGRSGTTNQRASDHQP